MSSRPALLALLIWICWVAAVRAQQPTDWPQAWAQEVLGEPVAAGGAAFAVAAVVQPNQPAQLFAFGRTEGPQGPPVDTENSAMLIASVTKVFTGLAVMQLVEERRIASVEDPANKYLRRIQLPDGPDGQPIRIRHLLTHTAGFEERGFGVIRSGLSAPASAEQIRAYMPSLVRPPGANVVYANIDPPLLGVLIEDLTGQTMQDYLAQRVFLPLEMNSSVLNYNQAGAAKLARPWRSSGDGKSAPLPLEINAPFFAPTGSIQTTAADMSRFIEAMLGRHADAVPDSVRLRSLAPLAGNHPQLPQLAAFWFVQDRGGVRIVDHAGAFSGFGAWVVLAPEAGVGMFAAWGGGPTAPDGAPVDFSAVRERFLEAAFGPAPAPTFAVDQSGQAAFVGRWWSERRPQTTSEMLAGLGAVRDIKPGPNGLLVNGRGPYRVTADGLLIGPGGDAMALSEGRLVRASEALRRVSGLHDPQQLQRLAMVAAVLGLTGFGAIAWRRGLLKWSGLLLALAILTAAGAMAAPGLIGDILAGRGWRFGALLSAATVIAASVPVLAVGAIRASLQPRSGGLAMLALVHRWLLLLAAGALTYVALFIRAFTPPPSF